MSGALSQVRGALIDMTTVTDAAFGDSLGRAFHCGQDIRRLEGERQHE
jgi:hypothetical protein